MRRWALLIAAVIAAMAFTHRAQARPAYADLGDAGPPNWMFESEQAGERSSRTATRRTARASLASGLASAAAAGVGPRPRRWCGWWMRTQLGGGPHLNVAWNWRHYGSPGSPQVGAVVVWRHHVGMIVGQAANGQWIVKSGNDGGQVRARARSIAGAIVRI